ncbi:ribonuclease, partial [Striga asiatica]
MFEHADGQSEKIKDLKASLWMSNMFVVLILPKGPRVPPAWRHQIWPIEFQLRHECGTPFLHLLPKVPLISPGYPLAALDMVLQNKAVFGMKMNDLHTNDPTYPDYVLLSYPHEFSIHGVRDPTKSGGPAFVAKLKLYWPDLRPPRRRNPWSFWKNQYDKHIAHPQTGLEVLDFFRLAVRMFEQLETPYLAIPRGISLDVSDFLNGYLNPAGHPPGLYRKVFVPVGDFSCAGVHEKIGSPYLKKMTLWEDSNAPQAPVVYLFEVY